MGDNLNASIRTLVQKLAQIEQLDQYRFTITGGSEKGDNFLGRIFKITVEDAPNDRKFNLVVKLAFDDQKFRNKHPIREIYQNEIYTISVVIPELSRFVHERNASEGILSNFVRCYLVEESDGMESIVMDDLCARGYQLFDKRDLLDDRHMKSVYESYAKLHALSFALKDQKPITYNQLVKGFNCNTMLKLWSSPTFGEGISYLTKQAEGNLGLNVREKWGKFVKSGRDIFLDILKADDSNAVITHGDCWSNNLMFRYEAEEIVDVKLIDWQLSKPSNPVLDLCLFFYSGASENTLDKFDEYLRFYYAQLSNYVKQLGSNLEEIFPFSVLQDDWKRYCHFGLIVSLFLHKIKLARKEDVVDFVDNVNNRSTSCIARTPCDEAGYNLRINRLVMHMYKNNLL